MNTNNNIQQLIFTYLSGKATPAEEEQLAGWLKESAENRKEYNQVRNIWHTLHPAFSPGSIDVEKAHNRVIQQTDSSKWYSSFLFYWKQAAAVLLLSLLLVSVYSYFHKETVYAEETFQEIFSPYGTRSEINLPDGSTVWLNAGSSIKFPAVFIPGKREVQLNGEGYFEVESDKANPFLVHLDKVTLQATGTSFNIEAYKNDSLIAITLIKGIVDITIGNTPSFNLLPGERMGFNKYTSQCEITKTDPYKWYAWKDGALVFRDDPLEYVFRKIGNTFNIEMEVNDPEIAAYPYRATFKEESLDEILRLMQLSAPIEYQKETRNQTDKGEFGKQKIKIIKAKKKNSR
ncbi:MAG: DUF4974 domain-containing protein [Tannerellaceae bacterium]|nr:DUF4974 domain-containing protein [Tannerellaceae bacterium]